jgi:hypothetical protein
MTAAERGAAIDAMETTYAEAGVGGFAAWVHERDPALRAQLERRGYMIDTSTRAMGMALDELRLPRPELELGPPDWSEYLGTALTAPLAHDARTRGCATASLQSTAMAEGVYAAVGFRDLGRFFEYVRR